MNSRFVGSECLRGNKDSLHVKTQNSSRFFVYVHGYYSGSGSSTDDEEDIKPLLNHDGHYTKEYLKVIKCLKHIQCGINHDSCILGLSLLSTCDLEDTVNISAILERDGLETLVNLVEVNHTNCRKGALMVLRRLTLNERIVYEVMHLGLAQVLVDRLVDYMIDTRTLACDVIANIGHNRTVSRAIRKLNGIQRLVLQLTETEKVLLLPDIQLTEPEREQIGLMRSAARALWTLASFRKNKIVMLKTGLIPLMTNIIVTGNAELSVPMTGVLSKCSDEYMFQQAIENEALVGNLLMDIREHYSIENKQLCVQALANAAGSNEGVRHHIHRQKGPEMAMKLLLSADYSDTTYIESLLSFIWKSAISMENVHAYEALRAHTEVMEWLTHTEVGLRTAATGAVAELAKSRIMRRSMVNRHVINLLMASLMTSYTPLIVNTAHALGALIEDEKALEELKNKDGVRLLWSMLKIENRDVRIRALWALGPAIRLDPESGERTRSICGAMELLITLLRKPDLHTLAAACAVISQVALDLENLAVMSEKGVVDALSRLAVHPPVPCLKISGTSGNSSGTGWTSGWGSALGIVAPSTEESTPSPERNSRESFRSHEFIKSKSSFSSKHTSTKLTFPTSILELDSAGYPMYPEDLRRGLCAAIANCCAYKDNARQFGLHGVIQALVSHLESHSTETRAEAARAFWKLSNDRVNCVHMHGCHTLPKLLKCMHSANQIEQISAAGCIKNIRMTLQYADIRSKCAGDHYWKGPIKLKAPKRIVVSPTIPHA